MIPGRNSTYSMFKIIVPPEQNMPMPYDRPFISIDFLSEERAKANHQFT